MNGAADELACSTVEGECGAELTSEETFSELQTRVTETVDVGSQTSIPDDLSIRCSKDYNELMKSDKDLEI